MTPEGRVKKRVKEILDALDIYHFFPPANGYGRAGIPDIIGCVNGQFIAIECKAGKGKATALQLRELDRIAVAGGCTFLIYETGINELEKELRCLKEKTLN